MHMVVGFLRFCTTLLLVMRVARRRLLAVTWALAHGAAVPTAWLVLPIGIILALGGSLAWHTCRR
jgi:hypothetical protein